MQWTWALVRRDSIMRWAMILRMWVMGTRSPGMEARGGSVRRSGFAAAEPESSGSSGAAVC